MPLATLTIPLGVVFLIIGAGCCLLAIATSKAITQGSRQRDDDLAENWDWPNR